MRYFTTMPHYNNFNTVSFHFGPVDDKDVGFFIGKKGATIKKIKSDSGAYVRVMTPDNFHPQSWFFVSGNIQSVMFAVNFLQQLRNEAENRRMKQPPPSTLTDFYAKHPVKNKSHKCEPNEGAFSRAVAKMVNGNTPSTIDKH